MSHDLSGYHETPHSASSSPKLTMSQDVLARFEACWGYTSRSIIA